MHEPPHPCLSVGRLDDITGPGVVDLVKLGDAPGPGAAGAVDDVRDAGHRLPEAGRLGDRAGPDLGPGEVGLDETPVAG